MKGVIIYALSGLLYGFLGAYMAWAYCHRIKGHDSKGSDREW